MKSELLKWDIVFKQPPKDDKKKKISLESGLDSFEILKKEKKEETSIYYIGIKKSIPIFDLNAEYRFLFKEDEVEKISNKKLEEKIRIAIGIEGSSLLSIFLRYVDIPPFPLLLFPQADQHE